MYHRNAIFIVTEEHSCSLYRVGDEFIIHDSTISVGGGKELCVWLVQLLTAKPSCKVTVIACGVALAAGFYTFYYFLFVWLALSAFGLLRSPDGDTAGFRRAFLQINLYALIVTVFLSLGALTA